MESAPLYLVLSSAVLLLTASILLPAYGKWRDGMDLARASLEAEKTSSAVESVSSLGDVGSAQQIQVELPEGYAVGFGRESIKVMRGGSVLREYRQPAELRFRGDRNLSGPGTYVLTVVRWPEEDDSNAEKDFLLEVLA